MLLDKNGAVIKDITCVQNSTIGADYIVIWDSDGIPIHIHRKVVEYLCNNMYGHTKYTSKKPIVNDMFLDSSNM